MPLRGGWERGGAPTPGGTLRGSDQGAAGPAFPLPNQLGKSAQLSEVPSGLGLSWGCRKEAGEIRRGRWEGPSITGGAEEEQRVFALPT